METRMDFEKNPCFLDLGLIFFFCTYFPCFCVIENLRKSTWQQTTAERRSFFSLSLSLGSAKTRAEKGGKGGEGNQNPGSHLGQIRFLIQKYTGSRK